MLSSTISYRQRLLDKSAEVFTGVPALHDYVSSALTKKYGGKAFNGVVAQTLYRFCRGRVSKTDHLKVILGDNSFSSSFRRPIFISGKEIPPPIFFSVDGLFFFSGPLVSDGRFFWVYFKEIRF